MKLFKYLFLILTLATLFACQKDPMSEITDGKWNKERNIINIAFEGQVGQAVITRTGNAATINFTYNTIGYPNLNAVKISALEISYGANIPVKAGETLNFQNATKTVAIAVTPANGDPLEWKLIMTPFNETILGTWDITGLYVYGGTGPAYGGSGVIKMSDKPWCWSTTEGPDKEQDNFLVFTLGGITANGNTYGTVVNNAGANGQYANFIYIAKTPNIDVNNFYRTIPKGEGKWARNYADGTVTFTFADGKSKVSVFSGAGTVNLGDGKSRIITDNAFTFSLSGVDDWNNIYNDFDKFVQNPRKYWVDVKKRP